MDIELDLLAGTDKVSLPEFMKDHKLAEGEIIGPYQKRKTSFIIPPAIGFSGLFLPVAP